MLKKNYKTDVIPIGSNIYHILVPFLQTYNNVDGLV